jgi:hypothetical protein
MRVLFEAQGMCNVLSSPHLVVKPLALQNSILIIFAKVVSDIIRSNLLARRINQVV